MRSVYDTLYGLARRSTRFAEWVISGWDRPEPAAGPIDGCIYRLRHWPDLPDPLRIAPVLRVLSVMSHRPVNRHWILSSTGLETYEVDALLQILERQDAVHVIDASRF